MVAVGIAAASAAAAASKRGAILPVLHAWLQPGVEARPAVEMDAAGHNRFVGHRLKADGAWEPPVVASQESSLVIAFRVFVGVVVVVAANVNSAAQGRRGCRLAIAAAILRLVVVVIVLISTITIAWDDDDKLPVILLRLVQFFYVWQELGRSHISSHSRHS